MYMYDVSISREYFYIYSLLRDIKNIHKVKESKRYYFANLSLRHTFPAYPLCIFTNLAPSTPLTTQD